MMPKRPWLFALFGLLAICALAVWWYWRGPQAPEVARLLPEAEAVVYFDLAPIRTATHFDQNRPQPSAEYQQFIDATGIVPERDLDEAAIALDRMANSNGPNGPVAYSEVFRGRFDAVRLNHYLSAQGASEETYAGHIIYVLPSDGRQLRVTVLDKTTLAASNAPTTEQIHAMIDRSAGHAPGNSLLQARFADVPRLSLAWGIGELALPFSEAGSGGHVSAAGLQLPIPADASFVTSVRYTTGLQLRVDELTTSAAAAGETAQNLNGLLKLIRTVTKSQKDAGLQQFLDSIAIVASKDRATLTATVPTGALKALSGGK